MSGDRDSLDDASNARPLGLSDVPFTIGNPMREPPMEAPVAAEVRPGSAAASQSLTPAALMRIAADRQAAAQALENIASAGGCEAEGGGSSAMLSNPVHDAAPASHGTPPRPLVTHSPVAPSLRHMASSKRFSSSGDLEKKAYLGSPLARHGSAQIRSASMADEAGPVEPKCDPHVPAVISASSGPRGAGIAASHPGDAFLPWRHSPIAAVSRSTGPASSHPADAFLPWRHSPVAALRRDASRNLSGSDDFTIGPPASRADA